MRELMLSFRIFKERWKPLMDAFLLEKMVGILSSLWLDDNYRYDD